MIVCAALLWAASSVLAADEAWDGKEQGERSYPLGPLGGKAIVHIGKPDFEVTALNRSEPGYRGGLREGDRIVAANGKAFEDYDNDPFSGGKGGPQGLGKAIEQSEGQLKGALALTVLRDGAHKELRINLKPLGPLSPDWPMDTCPKVQEFQDDVCDFVAGSQRDSGHWRTGYGHAADWVTTSLCGLALLGSAESRYKRNVRAAADFFARQDASTQGSSWALFYSGVFMCEYYLATEDKDALRFVEACVQTLQAHMNPENGRFGHGADPVSSGYNGSGINIVGAGAVWCWGLASKCGVLVLENTWDKSLDHLQHSVGRNGGIAYTRIPGGASANINSHTRTAHALMGLTLTGREKGFARRLTDYLHENPGPLRESHAYSCPSVAASFLALFMADRKAHRELLDEWQWYFTLARGPDGFAEYIGSKRNNGGDTYLNRPLIMNAMVGIVLAAHQQHLFMYGGNPHIPGVVPGEISTSLRKTYENLDRVDPVLTIKRLKGGLRGKDSPDSRAARAMIDHLVETRVRPEWEEVRQYADAGDIFKAYTISQGFVKKYGVLEAFKEELKTVEAVLNAPGARETIQRGKEYYRLVDIWKQSPSRRRDCLSAFEKLGEVDDIYGKKSRKTVQVIRQKLEAGS